MTNRVIVAAADPAARERLAHLLQAEPDVEVVAGSHGGDALQAIHRIQTLVEELATRERARDRDRKRLVIRTPERTLLLRVESIDWIEADGKFVQLHTATGVHAMRKCMAELEQQLDPAHFLRISRSAIVNLDRVEEIQPGFQGDYVLILAGGTRLTSTRGYRENMRRLLRK